VTFTEPFFLLVFLPLALLAVRTVARRFGADPALGVILVASLLFYLPWGPVPTAVLLASVGVNFSLGSALLQVSDSRPRLRMSLLSTGLACNLGLLIWFKYDGFGGWHSPEDGAPLATWVIPAGISFYTFHQAAFLADAFGRERSVEAWLGRAENLRDRLIAFVRYGAFVTFFPQLVIGPITYMREFAPQVARAGFGRVLRMDFAVGMGLIALGLFKKLVIADNLAPGADAVFHAASLGQDLHPIAAWFGVGLYYLQLYFDFSGYCDMALGLGRLFGIRYPINFDSPLRANGIVDYYRRWHMTLTRVISRFLFTPLSILGARFAGRRRHVAGLVKILGLWVPLMINFEVIGLWHGALWTFAVFGLIHGLWYVIETEVRGSRRWKAWRKRVPEWRRWVYGHLIFLSLMPLTFALFRADSLETFGVLANGLFVPDFAGVSPQPTIDALKVAVGATLIVYLAPNSVEFMSRWRPGIRTYVNPSTTPLPLRLRWRPDAVGAAFMAVIAAISLYFVARQAPFLYQGF
jgi:alginate O-acetyltransferase complex protein AlgI